MTTADPYAEQRAVYDLIHLAIRDHDREVTRLLKRVRGAIGRSPKSWLDVGCGTGQHLRALKSAGVDRLVGVDISPTQVEAAQTLLGTDAEVSLGDMRTLKTTPPDGGFDVVSCLFSGVGHLHSDSDYLAALRSMAAHMHPRGVVVVKPWIAAEDFTPGRVDVDVAERDALKVVRVTKHALAHADDCDFADLEFRFVVARAGVSEAEDWTTSLRLRLRSAEEQHGMFNEVFQRVDFVSTGAGSRGIFLARRPRRHLGRDTPCA